MSLPFDLLERTTLTFQTGKYRVSYPVKRSSSHLFRVLQQMSDLAFRSHAEIQISHLK